MTRPPENVPAHSERENRDSPHNADKIDIYFSDLDCIYRGNIYQNGRIIGDYAAEEAAQIERMFPQLVFNWG